MGFFEILQRCQSGRGFPRGLILLDTKLKVRMQFNYIKKIHLGYEQISLLPPSLFLSVHPQISSDAA